MGRLVDCDVDGAQASSTEQKALAAMHAHQVCAAGLTGWRVSAKKKESRERKEERRNKQKEGGKRRETA